MVLILFMVRDDVTDQRCGEDMADDSRIPHPGKRPVAGLSLPLLVALYLALALMPLVLTAVQGLPLRGFWREAGSMIALVGFAVLLVQFLFSGRFNRLSGQVGIDRLMRFHQIAGWLILLAILAHPVLYVVPALLPHPGDALMMLNRMFTSERLFTGVVAWWLLILLVVMAGFRDRLPISYELWRASHGLGSALIAGFGAHHTLAVGRYSGDVLLGSFWLLLTAVAIGSLVHVYVVKPWLQSRHPYRVVRNRKLADRMWEVVIEPENGQAPAFDAGQFAWVNFGHSPFSLTEHPFSIASPPEDRPRLSFLIKESGDFTNRIGQIPEGTVTYLDGPHGTFTLEGRAASRYVMIAGGVGFAPFAGMLRQMAHRGWPKPVTLIYGNRVESQILCAGALDAWRAEGHLSLHLVLSEPPEGWAGPKGELDRATLSPLIGAVDPEALFFVCGPPAMIDSVEKTLLALGVAPDRIVAERFKYS